MKRVPLIRVAAILPIYDFLVRSGARVEDILGNARLPPAVFDDPELLLPYGVVARFLDDAGRLDGNELIGARAGHATPVEALGVFGRRIAAGPTLGDALATAARLAPAYYSGESFWLTRVGRDAVRLSHRFPARIDDRHQQLEQFSLCVALRFLRSVAGAEWRPAVHLKSGMPGGIVNVPLLRRCIVRHDEPTWAITFPRALLRSHVRPAAIATLRSVEVEEWKASACGNDVASSVSEVIRTALVGGDAEIGVVASWMDTSTRTIQRRLGYAGVSYAQLLARARFAVATRLLDDPTLTVQDVGRRVGYSDPAHFTRAFRRWTGWTPRAFRDLRLAEAAALRVATNASGKSSAPTCGIDPHVCRG